MAEYSQLGLLAALLLFTALTVRDVYVGRSNPPDALQAARSQSADSPGPPPEPGKPAEPSLYPGPMLKFQYCQLYPDIHIEGENYPPTPLNRVLGQLISCLKLVSILLIVSGQNPFLLFGLNTPRAWTWSQDNKIFSCLMAFFLCNMMETHFLSTGAFELTLNDVPVWSKLQSGYVPNIQEIFQILDTQLKMNQALPSGVSAQRCLQVSWLSAAFRCLGSALRSTTGVYEGLALKQPLQGRAGCPPPQSERSLCP
ncbi:hypothetical protein FQN60_001049, partial [Etheostoma spectabile]